MAGSGIRPARGRPVSAGETPAGNGPLAGLRVIEFAGIGPGPFCGMVLGDLGAEVIRVGRTTEVGAETGAGMASITAGVMLRNRRSIALDLKKPAAREIALELVAGADASLESFRPGVMERLGLGPEVCLERNPSLVYGRLTGWGQTGSYAQSAGHDLNYIAVAGALHPIGRRGQRPVPPLNLVGDFGGGGMMMAMGTLAGLIAAMRSGRGQVVDAAMVDGAAYLMAMNFELLGRGVWVDERESNPGDGGAHFYDTYETADGRHLAIAAMEPQFYADLLERLGLAGEELPEQWDRSAWPAMKRRLAAIFRTRSRDEWDAALAGTDCCYAPVLSMREAIHHPANRERGVFLDVGGLAQVAPAPRFLGTPAPRPEAGPAPGQHTDGVLRELGYAQERIASLRQEGAVA